MQPEPRIIDVKPGVRIREKEPSIQDRLGINVRMAIGERQVKRAESEIAKFEGEFPNEALHEITLLQQHYKHFQTPIKKDSEPFIDFTTRTLDLKSAAGMFGYPLATLIANSLFNYCQNDACNTDKSLQIIRLHIATLERIFKDNMQDETTTTAKELVTQFHALTK